MQITDGEVTLRPVEELIEILRYARSIGIVPMVMTHGDNFRRQPGLLERLMSEGHLTEVSIHIDITQRGRDGYRAPKSELELMPLRDEFAAMIRDARADDRPASARGDDAHGHGRQPAADRGRRALGDRQPRRVQR